MKHKKLKLSVVLFLGLGLTGLQAQTMTVKETGGSQTLITLSDVQKMTFSSGNLTVTKTDASSSDYALSGLRYLTFSDYTTNVNSDELEDLSNLNIYPNPVTDILTIDLTNSNTVQGTISIISLDGKELIKANAKDESMFTINLSRLTKGMYLCQYKTKTEFKTVKIIKE